jgi:hypothetical protein
MFSLFIAMPEIPYTPISKARLFILQSLIAGCLSCQGTLMLAAEKSSFPTCRKEYFSHPPCLTDRQSCGQKNNQPSDTGCIRGK